MTKLFIRHHDNKSSQPLNLPLCEEHYNAIFVGDFCVKTKDGSWSEIPIAIFYQPNPNFELGHTHYFGLFVVHDNQIAITKGDSAFEEPITGIIADDGEVIFSRYRHDFVRSHDQSVFIDGGRDYVRCGGEDNRLVELVINKHNLEIVPESIDKSFRD